MSWEFVIIQISSSDASWCGEVLSTWCTQTLSISRNSRNFVWGQINGYCCHKNCMTEITKLQCIASFKRNWPHSRLSTNSRKKKTRMDKYPALKRYIHIVQILRMGVSKYYLHSERIYAIQTSILTLDVNSKTRRGSPDGSRCNSTTLCEAGVELWLEGEAACQPHSFSNAEPRPVIKTNQKQTTTNMAYQNYIIPVIFHCLYLKNLP